MSTEDRIKELSAQLDRIEQIAAISAKQILTMDEAVTYTGFTKAFLYKQTSDRTIPHFKKNRKVLFRKGELEEWLTDNRVSTDAEMQSKASTYILNNRK